MLATETQLNPIDTDSTWNGAPPPVRLRVGGVLERSPHSSEAPPYVNINPRPLPGYLLTGLASTLSADTLQQLDPA